MWEFHDTVTGAIHFHVVAVECGTMAGRDRRTREGVTFVSIFVFPQHTPRSQFDDTYEYSAAQVPSDTCVDFTFPSFYIPLVQVFPLSTTCFRQAIKS